MLLHELFKNDKIDWKWGFRGSQEAEATFVVGDVQYHFYAYSHSARPTIWEVEFRAVEGVDPRNKFGVTGTGNAAQVMAIVVEILGEFLQKYDDKIQSLTFSAKERSRRDLYARMVRRLLPNWDFKLEDRQFFLTRPTTIKETAEEDRALVSLSSAIYKKVIQHVETDDEHIELGKIGEMFDTSIVALNNVSIDIQGGDSFHRRLHDIPPADILGDKIDNTAVAFWDEDVDTVVLNRYYLGTERIKTTITHELRHALDSIKSDKFPGDASRYFTPKKKEHRQLYYTDSGEIDKSDVRNLTPYRAQPAEINARFAEVLHALSDFVAKRYNTVAPHLIKRQLSQDFKKLMNKFQISYLFPEKDQSRDYKRLVKRAYDFMEKEIAHVESELAKQGSPKKATGSF
jgi:hypothetical protein